MTTRGSHQQPFSSTGPSVYLLDLTVRDVRCFGPEEQMLRLSDSDGRPAPWTVILGENGVGKTTLLQCLVALEPRRHVFRHGHEECPLIELPISSGDWWRIYRNPRLPEETFISGTVAVGSRLGSAGAPSEKIEIVVPTSSEKVDSMLMLIGDYELSERLRCCGYGATRRMGSATLSRGLDDPAASLFLDSVDLVDVEEWLLVEDYARTRGATQDTNRLQRIKAVLIDLLPDVGDLRVAESPKNLSRGLRPVIEVRTPFG